jgi:hypothetical protein
MPRHLWRGEEALDDPASWQDDEANLPGDFADDLDADIGGGSDRFRIVAAVGPDQANEREERARDLLQRGTAVAILDIGSMGFDKQGAPIIIDQSMTLAPLDLLTCIIVSRSAAFRCFNALAIDDYGAGAGLKALPSQGTRLILHRIGGHSERRQPKAP